MESMASTTLTSVPPVVNLPEMNVTNTGASANDPKYTRWGHVAPRPRRLRRQPHDRRRGIECGLVDEDRRECGSGAQDVANRAITYFNQQNTCIAGLAVVTHPGALLRCVR
jgi:hypothetical protein